jgi:hypothetical protein
VKQAKSLISYYDSPNVVCMDVDIFGARNVLLNRLYNVLLLLLLFGC